MATTLELQSRTPGKTRAARALRRDGRIPGILYGRGLEPLPFSVDVPSLREALSGDAGRHAVLEIAIAGRTGSVHAVLKDYQLDPVRDRLVHVDLLEISMTERLVATVAIRLDGEAPGVREGGVLDQPLHELQVEALPANLPSELVADVSVLQIGESLKAGEIPLPDGVTLSTDPDAVVAAVTHASTMEQIEAEQAAEAEAAGGEPAEVDGGEPDSE